MPNHTWVIYTFKDRLMDFIILRHERFVDMASDSTLQLIFKKLPLVKWNIGSKIATIISKTYSNTSFFKHHFCMTLAFPCILQTEKSIATD